MEGYQNILTRLSWGNHAEALRAIYTKYGPYDFITFNGLNRAAARPGVARNNI